MQGLEELIKCGYVAVDKLDELSPKPWGAGSYGLLTLGATTLGVLSSYLNLTLEEAAAFVPVAWKAPKDYKSAQPDELLVLNDAVEVVIEYKSVGEIRAKKNREAALEQLHSYCLATNAKLGVLTIRCAQARPRSWAPWQGGGVTVPLWPRRATG